MNPHSSAIAPNILDGYADTQFLLPLVLGNLLSQNLWDFSARIQNKVALTETEAGVSKDPLIFIRAIQKQLDRQFRHLHPKEVAQIYGELTLSDERNRLGSETVDQALHAIEVNFHQRMREGSIPSEALNPLLERIKLGYFPAFYYGNIDIVLANKRLLGRKSSAPMGLTSCLDEIAIFASLAMTMPGGSVANVIALTSASHYTAFGWTPEGEMWWFYGKNILFSRQDWSEVVAQKFDGHAQEAFNYYFRDMQRIVCVTGVFDFISGETEISQEHLSEIIERLDHFFGVRLKQVTEGISTPAKRQNGSELAPVLRALLGTKSLEVARQCLLSQQDSRLSQVLYSYRTLELQDLRPYLRVARNQPLCRALGRSLHSRQDAIDVIKNLVGKESIFKDRNRVAMPDETLRLNTGSDRDKALLLHVLWEHFYAVSSLSAQVTTLLTQEDSFVCVDDFCFSIQALNQASRPTSGIFAQFMDEC